MNTLVPLRKTYFMNTLCLPLTTTNLMNTLYLPSTILLNWQPFKINNTLLCEISQNPSISILHWVCVCVCVCVCECVIIRNSWIDFKWALSRVVVLWLHWMESKTDERGWVERDEWDESEGMMMGGNDGTDGTIGWMRRIGRDDGRNDGTDGTMGWMRRRTDAKMMALTIVMGDEWEDTGKEENMGWIRRIGRDEASDGKDDQTETIGWMMEHLRRMKKDEMIGRMSQMMMQMSRIWD